MVGTNEIVPFKDTEGQTFTYWHKMYSVPLYSQIKVQTIDPSAYTTQLKMFEGFVSDMRDLLYAAQEEKLGKSVEAIEKIDARLCMEVSQTVRDFNTKLNSIHGLSASYPILTQNRGRPYKGRR